MRLRFIPGLLLAAVVAVFCAERAVAADEPAREQAPPAQGEVKNGFSPLHFAAMRGDEKEAKRLLKAGADVNVKHAEFRGAPLQYAASAGKVELVKLLMSHDATVDSVDSNGRTPLMWAAQRGKADVVKVLLDAGANIGAANDGGWTPLHYSMSYNHAATTELLLERGASKELLNRQGKTPLDVKGTNAQNESEE